MHKTLRVVPNQDLHPAKGPLPFSSSPAVNDPLDQGATMLAAGLVNSALPRLPLSIVANVDALSAQNFELRVEHDTGIAGGVRPMTPVLGHELLVAKDRIAPRQP